MVKGDVTHHVCGVVSTFHTSFGYRRRRSRKLEKEEEKGEEHMGDKGGEGGRV